jgi:CTP:molybdopterin cytidylyltransferase MocA
MRRQHKLLLPWPVRGKQSFVVGGVLSAWLASRVDRVCIVIREDDHALRSACSDFKVDIVSPESPPAFMKDSILAGLSHIRDVASPNRDDYWLVAPADLPTLTPELIDAVIAGSDGQHCVVPRFAVEADQLRQGHPVAFPWFLAEQAAELADDQGINQLLESNAIHWLDLPGSMRPPDMDTPEDYQQLLAKLTQDSEEEDSASFFNPQIDWEADGSA